jgi:branched-chain amino acid transport system ATP-binding protein
MLDEPSLGIAPLMAEAIYAAVRRLSGEGGLTVLLVEQNASLALDASRNAFVLENGRVVLDGTSDELKRSGASSTWSRCQGVRTVCAT